MELYEYIEFLREYAEQEAMRNNMHNANALKALADELEYGC